MTRTVQEREANEGCFICGDPLPNPYILAHEPTSKREVRICSASCDMRGLAAGSIAHRVLDDGVNHPAHYGGEDDPYEAIKMIDAWGMGLVFCLATALKYIARRGRKPGELAVKDLKKALWYLQHAEHLPPEQMKRQWPMPVHMLVDAPFNPGAAARAWNCDANLTVVVNSIMRAVVNEDPSQLGLAVIYLRRAIAASGT